MDRSWFHSCVTGAQAENLLKNEGKHGSFLFRPSSTVGGQYCLSVRVGESVTHVRIKNDGNCFNLLGGADETFATLGELVRHYADDSAKPLRDTAGTVIELKYPLPSVDHNNQRFFHHSLTGTEAEKRMLSVASLPGTFLVRDSQRQCDSFVLSVVVLKQNVKVLHVMITFQNGKYGIGDGYLFNSLSELVNHYRRNTMKDKSGIEVTLKQAVDLTRLKASEVDYRVAQLEMEFTLNGAQRSGFWEEFEHLQMQENVQAMSRSAGEKPDNKKKNRYKNILPFDDTRVILSDVETSLPGSDYINANHVQVPDTSIPGGRRRYIATQGCLLLTIQDFWLMALQQKSSIIVMITKIVEDGKNKCALYWPEDNSKDDIYNIYQGTITVTMKSKENVNNSTYIRRVFEVVKQQRKGQSDELETETRTFYHYQYPEWKDKRVPTADQISEVLWFVQDVDKQWRETNFAGPLIVHCSAGIGRTGTFIVIDTIINQIMQQGLETEIDIFKTILGLRQQRSGFVQTDLQYKFIYIAIKRFVEQRRNPSPQLSPAVQSTENFDIYENIGAADSASGGGAVHRPSPKPKPSKLKPTTATKPRKPSTDNGDAGKPQENSYPANVYENLNMSVKK